ncbi:OmpA/MotB [Salinisphaera sp. PC39]|uniref:OmpA family protein n=1 Tax=Salinisphaera sp. PC39 TaxID=1304156 RepID=UPI00333F4205
MTIKRSVPSLLGAAGILLAGSAAHATEPGWYVEGGLGATELKDADNETRTEPSFTSTPGGGFLVIPGLGTLFPTPGGTTTQPGDPVSFETEYDTGYLGSLALGYAHNNGWRTEIEARYALNDLDRVTLREGFGNQNGETRGADGEYTSTSLMANAWYEFNADGDWHPYLGGGVGAARLDYEALDFNEDDMVFAYQVGAGISYDLTDYTSVSLGYRYFGTDDPSFSTGSSDFQDLDSEYQQHAALLSLRYTFAPAERPDSDGDGVPDIHDECPNTPKGAAVDSKGCPLDSDGDGVPDYKDKCPNTPKGVQVGPEGCPLDSDGDGVPDYKDECPNTPAGTQVDDKGCPLVQDADGDGVPDDRDQCPDTPEGVAVLANGCAVGQSAILQGVNFEFNRTRLTASAQRILDRVATALKDSPEFRVEIAGHTDSLGSASYNRQLSQERAEAVRQYLIQQGVDGDRLVAEGYGESEPIADNTNPDGTDNPEGRATNRRVELRVVDRSE